MFGQNAVADIDHREDGSLLVHSLFYTIQGEGPDAGCPAIFMRLARCNLRCWFCDTEFEQGTRYQLAWLVDEVVGMSKEYHCKLVVITGGEPLLQNIIPFVRHMSGFGIRVSVETAGTVWLEGVQEYFADQPGWRGNTLVCSPKTPKINERLSHYIGAFKYIIRRGETDPSDGLPIKSTQLEGDFAKLYRPTVLQRAVTPIYVQPCDEQDEVANLENAKHAAAIAMRHGYRLSMQLHKIVGLP